MTIYTSRTPLVTAALCMRKRYWEHELGRGEVLEDGGVHCGGLQLRRASIYLLTGSAVHLGLQTWLLDREHRDVDGAVTKAIGMFWDEAERRGILTHNEQDNGSSELPEQDSPMVRWTTKEQAALAEGLLRGWVAWRGREFLAQWEVLTVERELTFELGQTLNGEAIQWQSRPDAVLRDRQDGRVAVLSVKTAGKWGRDGEQKFKIDKQLLSEAVAVERVMGVPVAGVQMEVLIKGQRRKDERLGWKVTYCPLIRGWKSKDELGPTQRAWSWETPKWDKQGQQYMGKLSGANWQPFYAWEEPGGVKGWVAELAANSVQPECGNALERCFVVPAKPYVVQPHKKASWLRQAAAEEREIAAKAAIVEKARRAGRGFVEALDTYFPQNTDTGCLKYGADQPCSCWMICHGTQEIGEDPIGSGLYQLRVPHHSEEGEEEE